MTPRPGRTLRTSALVVLAAATATALAACSSGSGSGSGSSGSSSSGPSTSTAVSATPAKRGLSGSITVDAAASLNTVFPKLATAFEAANPGTTVQFSFGGSSALAAAIVAGSPVDVFAAASTKTMQTVVDAGLTDGAPVVIARNTLEIAVPPGNPGRITGLKDFADSAKTIVVCAKTVPCGVAAQAVFALGKVTAKPDSYEPDVTSVLTKVESGDADAGMVYRTDVLAAGSKVQGIPFTQADSAITAYPIAPLTASKNAALARAFADYVVKNGSADLTAAGFLAPQ